MIVSSLSRNQAYDFFQMGTLLERADMTTRILDVAAGILLRRHIDVSVYDTLIWLEILKAQNAVLMYRSANGPVITPKNVLYFILCKSDFPRSIKYCLVEIQCFAAVLPDKEAVFNSWENLNQNLNFYNLGNEINPEQLHVFFDDIQKSLITLHNSITNTWFPSTPETLALIDSKTLQKAEESEPHQETATVQIQSQS